MKVLVRRAGEGDVFSRPSTAGSVSVHVAEPAAPTHLINVLRR